MVKCRDNFTDGKNPVQFKLNVTSYDLIPITKDVILEQ